MLPLLHLASLIFLESIITFFTRFYKLSKRFLSFSFSSSKALSKIQLRKAQVKRTEIEAIITREEVGLVMEKMGLMMEGNEEGFQEFEAMFEEMEPSVEELREAFSVFDENGDGFVGAKELQRVLWMLGFQGVEIDSCVEMIDAYDGDGDGLMDFGDFVRLLESSFY